MALLDWPAVRAPAEFAAWIVAANVAPRGTFSGRYTVTPRYQEWRARVRWNAMLYSEAAPIFAILMQLRGQVNSVKLPLHDYRAFVGGSPPGGSGTLAADISAGQRALTITGGSGLVPGDRIQFTNAHVHVIVTASGEDFTVEPEFRADRSAGALVENLAGLNPLTQAMFLAGEPPPISVTPSPGDDKLTQPFMVEFTEPL